MRLKVLAIGSRMPSWITEGFREYAKRMPKHLSLELQEITPPRRASQNSPDKLKAIEADAILEAIKPSDRMVALDVKGKSFSTEQLAETMSNWEMQAVGSVILVIGGPDGLHQRCLARADEIWSLSKLTLPHPLVRVVLIEQLYRACMINAGHPYHRE